jgi:hypothetical protein
MSSSGPGTRIDGVLVRFLEVLMYNSKVEISSIGFP